jgi:CelD/BcsL family acetyltransferase involved in cellulose biosynthesis
LYEDPAGVLRLIGAGNTDYLDVLAEPGIGLDWVFGNCANAEFQDVRDSSPLARAAPARASLQIGEPCPVLELPDSVEQWRERLPHGIKRNLRRYRERLGDVRFETTADPSLLEELFRLHGARWELRGAPGVLADSALRDFHREVAEGFARRGWLRFWTVYAGRRTVAVIYAFVCRGCAYFYIGGFEPEFASFGPGTLAIGYAVERAICEGVREIHFLRGAEAYKYAWGAQDRRNVTIRVGLPTCHIE